MAERSSDRRDTLIDLGSSMSEVDAGLRDYLQRVYGLMSGGLALTGLVASLAAMTGLYVALAGTAFFWVILLAPLALVLLLSFRIEKMSLGAAHLAFWSYAVLVGLSLGGLFLIYTGESIGQTFLVAAAMFLGMSLYGTCLSRTLKKPPYVDSRIPG